MDFSNILSITIDGKEVKNITVNGKVVWESKEIEDDDKELTPLYIENVGDSDGVFKLNKSASPTTLNLIYRIGDNGEWFEYDTTNLPSITVPSGSKIYFRGDNVNRLNQDNYNYYYFTFSKSYNIGGYITSLISTTDFNIITDISNYCFYRLFYDQINLLNTNDLITDNIINVGDYGFKDCFYSCNNLKTAPLFENVTTVGDYGFDTCFYSCNNLITAPTFENVTTVENIGFRGCFYSCNNLITAPTFENVTTVGNNGFQTCFSGCNSLVTTPNFSNIKTVEIRGFSNCFSGCTSLQVVYAPNVTTWDESKFENWLNNVYQTGVIYKPTGLEIPTGTSGVPDGWTTAEK